MDIVAGSYGSQIVIHENDGAGNFTRIYDAIPDDPFDYYGYCSGALAVDVDNDQDADIVAYTSAVQIFLNDGGMTFTQTPYEQVIDGSAVLADVDLDGDLDLVESQVRRNLGIDLPQGPRGQYGDGVPGEGGIVPVLGVDGSVNAGQLATFQVAGASGTATMGFLMTGEDMDAIANYPVNGHVGLVSQTAMSTMIPMAFTGTPGPAGGTSSFTVLVGAGLAGVSVYHQVFVVDPLGVSGYSSTNGLRVTYQP